MKSRAYDDANPRAAQTDEVKVPSSPTKNTFGDDRPESALSAVDVWLTYPGPTPIQALRGASIDLEPGTSTSILGPSGSGKSTLLKCLAGMLVPTSGHVVFHGQPFQWNDDSWLSAYRRHNVGFVPQAGALLDDLSVLDNVAVPAVLAGSRRGPARSTASDALDFLALGDLADRMPTMLSGGQRQMVAIARSLVNSPLLILADEPTGELDSVAADHVMDMLVQLADSTGRVVVVVTHSARLASFCDRQMVLSDGRFE